MKIFIAISFSVFIVISTTVWAHSGATGIVKERMMLMESLKDSMKILKPIFQGKTIYDPIVVKQEALEISRRSADHMTTLFPEGSLQAPSEAKDKIWTSWDEFKRLADDLEVLANQLANSNDKKAALPVFREIANNCQSCHKKYREE